MATTISCSIPARIGLLGNPSDGYFGECISLPAWDWKATVNLTPNDVNVLPADEGLLRIMEPTMKVFQNQFNPPRKPFIASVQTNIPRQVGLSGSSAIETAFILALMAHHEIPVDCLSSRELAELVLKIETEELGIVAGLQDRLPQAYGCMLHMDFREDLMKSRGYGEYTELNSSSLPPLWLAHAPMGKDSGETHSDLPRRWAERDEQMVSIIGHLAECAREGRDAIESGDSLLLASNIDTNFDLRRELFGDQALGESLDAVMLARSLGSCAKQTGSGGAIFGIIPDNDFCQIAPPAFAKMGWEFHAEIEVGT